MHMSCFLSESLRFLPQKHFDPYRRLNTTRSLDLTVCTTQTVNEPDRFDRFSWLSPCMKGYRNKTQIQWIGIIHWDAMIDREVFMRSVMSEIVRSELDICWGFLSSWNRDRLRLDETTVKNVWSNDFSFPNLRTSDLSRSATAMEIIETFHIIAVSRGPVLLLEDDVELIKYGWLTMKEALRRISRDDPQWGMVFVSECSNLHSSCGRMICKENHSRCTSGILISPNGAREFLARFQKNPIEGGQFKAMDHHMNKIIPHMQHKTYWMEPPVCRQRRDLFGSSVTGKNR